MSKDWTKFAASAWEELIILAKTEGGTITYKSLEKVVGLDEGQPGYNFTGRNSRHILTPILDHCRARGLPLLSVLAHNWQGKRGDGYVGYHHRTEQEEVEEVRTYNWEQTTNVFNQTRSHAATKALLSSGKTGLQEWLITYPGRGYQQQVFRSALLKAYGNRCAVCPINHPALLEAAHLKPWNVATAAERVDVRNGILLCRNHHAAFDRGLWRIEIENGMRKSANVQFGEQQYELPTVRTHELRLPREVAWQPLEEWLLWRRR